MKLFNQSQYTMKSTEVFFFFFGVIGFILKSLINHFKVCKTYVVN